MYASVVATEVIQLPASFMAVLRQLNGRAKMRPSSMQDNACLLPYAREKAFSAALKHSRQLQRLHNQQHPHHRHSRCAGPFTVSNISARHLKVWDLLQESRDVGQALQKALVSTRLGHALLNTAHVSDTRQH